MKKTGILKAMKLCMDYEKMTVEEKERMPRKIPGNSECQVCGNYIVRGSSEAESAQWKV